jgi:hypothetical protein
MNLQARIDKYRERGIQELDAHVLLLIEESAVALFNSFPDHFILFGGVTLVLFHESPRVSRDLDLLSSPGQPPSGEDIEKVVHAAIQPIAEVLGLGQIEFRQDIATAGLTRQWVLANQKPLFQHRSNDHRWRCPKVADPATHYRRNSRQDCPGSQCKLPPTPEMRDLPESPLCEGPRCF